MGTKMKEDEKTERAIRSLLKLQENRRCINCNSLGPQYVCTNFLTFICTNCSGIHWEFTHRVKSISMAKFTAEDVRALQAGGNEKARQIYFKEWNPQHNTYPDGSNLHRLRDFIKHVYVDRKYTGERSMEKLPRLKMSDKEEHYENRNINSYRFGSRSPHHGDRHEPHYIERCSPAGRSEDRDFKYYYDERRSPRYAKENSRSGGQRRNPTRFEVVDDRFRDDGFRSGRRSEKQRFSIGESKVESRSSDPRTMDRSSSPPVGHISGENAPPLRVGESSKTNDEKDTSGYAHNKNTTSSGGPDSADVKPVDHKVENSESLIDLNNNSEVHNVVTEKQTKNMLPSNYVSSEASISHPAKGKKPQVLNTNTWESLLFELSVPSATPVDNTTEVPIINHAPSTASGGNCPADGIPPVLPVGQMSLLPDNSVTSTATSITNVSVHSRDPPQSSPNYNDIGVLNVKVLGAQKFPSMQEHQPTPSPVANSASDAQHVARPNTAPTSQPLTSSLPTAQAPAVEQESQDVMELAQDKNSGVGSQPRPMKTKSNRRQELPSDLFTATFSSVPQPVPRWQTAPPHGMGYNLQYYPNAMVPAYHNPTRSANPFDFNGETTQFPSMESLQVESPSVSNGGGLSAMSNLGDHAQGFMLPQSLAYASTMPPGAYMEHQVQNYLPPSRPQGLGGFGCEGAIYDSLNTYQHPAGRNSASTTQDSFSSTGGNPFG